MKKSVGGVLAEVLNLPAERITDDLQMKDVDAWDSLTHMELVMAIEQTFQIELTFEEIVAMRSVGEINRILRQKKALG